MKEIHVDLDINDGWGPTETRVRAFVKNEKLIVWYQDTDCNVIDFLTPAQKRAIWWVTR